MRRTNHCGSLAIRTRSWAAAWGCCALLLSSLTAVALEPIERTVWRKIPIAVDLAVGQERRVHFSGPVSVGLPANLQARLRIQSSAGTVYWLATHPFAPTRILVRTLDDGQVYLLDVSASTEGGSAASLAIVSPPEPAAAVTDPARTEPSLHGYVSLTRFAAQQLYTPLRLLTPLPGVVRVPVSEEPIALVRGGAIVAVPLASWRSGSRFVTAVKLTNTQAEAQELQVDALRGRWLAATFQHHRVLPAGDEADHTVVYLISDRAFRSAL